MTIKIGNAPCSWGVETADDERNPPWTRVLDECKAAGSYGIELGAIGFMPEDPALLSDALAQRELQLTGGVVFRPFHDATNWGEVKDAATRTCKSLEAHGARHLVLIDSISPRRAPTAGRPDEAKQISNAECDSFASRFRDIAIMGTEEFGLTVSLHLHAAGFLDFEFEVERLLAEIDAKLLNLCLDTGYDGWCTVEQNCDPAGPTSPVDDARANRDYLSSIHF